MQSLKRSLRFRWSSSQMEANLEASDLTATELPPTYLRAFHSLIALDSSSTFLISWFSFLGWGWGLGAGASGFLPPTKDANEKSEDAKRFKRRSKVKESEHFLDVVVLLLRLLLGVGMILLSLLRLLLFLLVGAAVTVLEKIERKGKR